MRCIYSFDFPFSDNILYFIPGEQQNGLPIRLFNAHAKAAQVQYSFEPTIYPFNRPHVIRVSKDGRYIYVGELGYDRGRVLQFTLDHDKNEIGIVICIFKIIRF